MRRGIPRSVFFLVAAFGVASVSCGGGGDSGTGPGGGGGPVVTKVDVSPGSANIFVGKTATFTATPKDVDGATVTGKSIAWSSSDQSIATVSNGVVTAVKPGNATITAAVGSVQGTATVAVAAPVASVEVTPATPSVVIGGTTQLTATLKDAGGNVLTDRTVTWTSDNDLIASVSSTGLVTTKSVGTATITATVEGKSATAKVTITPVPVASVSVSPATSSLVIGATVQLSATTKDESGNTLSGRTVTWTTSDASVASVDGNGLVKAVALGSATITATSETKTATAQITVTEAPVASVAVSPATVSVALNATTQLTATTSDANGYVLNGRTVTWSSSDPSKATVDATGLVKGLAYGQVIITATSEGKTGTATVKVSDGIAPDLVGLTFNPSQTVDVSTGAQTITIVGHIKDAGGSGTAQFAVKASAPNGVFLTCAASSPASGDTSDGTWNCPINIPAGADPGTWKLFILVSDVGLSAHTYSEADLTAAGLPTGFTVTSPTPDNAAPAIVSLQLSPASVNVSSGASTMTVTAQLTDDVSGIAQFDFVGTSPSGDKTVTCSDVTASGQTKLSGTWSCTVTIPADAESGTWTIYVRATDRTSKFSFLPRADGFPAGFASSFTVTR